MTPNDPSIPVDRAAVREMKRIAARLEQTRQAAGSGRRDPTAMEAQALTERLAALIAALPER